MRLHCTELLHYPAIDKRVEIQAQKHTINSHSVSMMHGFINQPPPIFTNSHRYPHTHKHTHTHTHTHTLACLIGCQVVKFTHCTALYPLASAILTILINSLSLFLHLSSFIPLSAPLSHSLSLIP